MKISHFLRTVPLHLLVEPLLQDEVSGVKSRKVVGQLAVICLGVLRKKFQEFFFYLKKKEEWSLTRGFPLYLLLHVNFDISHIHTNMK